MFSKRPIAVDWAIPKNLYNGAADAATAPADGMLPHNLMVLNLFLVILYPEIWYSFIETIKLNA